MFEIPDSVTAPPIPNMVCLFSSGKISITISLELGASKD